TAWRLALSDLQLRSPLRAACMKLQPWPHPFNHSLLRWLPRPSPRDALFSTRVRQFSASTPCPYRPLETLPDPSLDTFRQQCFVPEQPAVLPRSQFRDLPALRHWFLHSPSQQHVASKESPTRLNLEYLQKHAANAFVPLEFTEVAASNSNSNDTTDHNAVSFRQFHAPLTLFLDWMRVAETAPQSSRLYLAQCQLFDLSPELRQDFPTPDLVAQAGKGDIYDTNVWIGHPPTYTPLHRDPNPNLFVQLAGQKIVRLLAPKEGQALFSATRRRLGKSGDREAAAFRGEEMMQGQERALLDEVVWGIPISAGSEGGTGYEACLGAGDGLFIPKGWWHSIKGVGEGVTASVSQLVVSMKSHRNPPEVQLLVSAGWFWNHLRSAPQHFNRFSPSRPPLPYFYGPSPSMQLARTAYRAALLHLSVNPILIRASIPTAWAPNTLCHLQTPSSRLYTVLFPQCALVQKPLQQSRQSHTMSTSIPDSSAQKPDSNESQSQETPSQSSKEQLYLPSSESSDAQQPHQLDLGAEGGSTVTLDHLGPMVVNVDGTLSRIGNWEQMTEIERKTTLRVLGKRNKQRLDALKAARAEEEQK
ncbi:uncharacterized protein N7459_009838, partial [Penicillium hispanicum]|uniref:uncharacterized protein n=1 Tax=Penicillium hispanicum TaxID=1080232 RepID=UPI0025404AA6